MSVILLVVGYMLAKWDQRSKKQDDASVSLAELHSRLKAVEAHSDKVEKIDPLITRVDSLKEHIDGLKETLSDVVRSLNDLQQTLVKAIANGGVSRNQARAR